jgi:hypothetical protein
MNDKFYPLTSLEGVDRNEKGILKIPLQEWMDANPVAEKYFAHDSAYNQMIYMRDQFSTRLYKSYESWKNSAKVISDHTSKSVKLPVYFYDTEVGCKLIARDNFYDFKVSIISEIPVFDNFGNLFSRDVRVSSSCCEGFPKNLIFGSYYDNPCTFTIEISNQHDMSILAFLLAEGDRLRRLNKTEI